MKSTENGKKKEKARTNFDLTKRLQRREISSSSPKKEKKTDDDDEEEEKKRRRRQQQRGVVSVVDSRVGPSGAFAEQIARVEQHTESSKIVAAFLYRR